jgi:hypothetical protein
MRKTLLGVLTIFVIAAGLNTTPRVFAQSYGNYDTTPYSSYGYGPFMPQKVRFVTPTPPSYGYSYYWYPYVYIDPSVELAATQLLFGEPFMYSQDMAYAINSGRNANGPTRNPTYYMPSPSYYNNSTPTYNYNSYTPPSNYNSYTPPNNYNGGGYYNNPSGDNYGYNYYNPYGYPNPTQYNW